ncbi:MAG TPA: ankyrin repeat domain-containing protein [Streptosporangiaceae bacterium]
MATLPARPDLGHLRRQARDLLRAARSGDSAAAGRVAAVSDRTTLAAAQLAVAREYGFASWARLKTAVDARTRDLAELAGAFCEASIRQGTGQAARMLAETPELADYSFATAVILGDADRVRREIDRDPGSATRPDERWGWLPLHAVCASRWHRFDPARAGGLEAVARLLLDAGADPRAVTSGRGSQAGGWIPLTCAVAGAANPAIARLLLEHGAVPGDRDLYLAGFADDDHQCLRLLIEHAPNVTGIARMALAAPISSSDTEGVRLLLDAGADPGRFLDDGERPAPVIYAAVRAGCAADLVELLLAHGGAPAAPGPDGRSPHALAVSQGRSDLADLLRSHGAADDATDADRLLQACLQGDAVAARRQLARDPGLLSRLTSLQQGTAMARAAESGNAPGVAVMLDLGFAVDAIGADGGTALHAASYAGTVPVIRLLLDRGADLEARDTTWSSTPLIWAIIGSGEAPDTNPGADWLGAVQLLIEAGASTGDVTLSADDAKPPSAAVAEYLRRLGIGEVSPQGRPAAP